MKKEDAVLVVSFGTSYNDSRKKTIEEIEKTIAGHFHGYEFHRAFTSRVIINILKNGIPFRSTECRRQWKDF